MVVNNQQRPSNPCSTRTILIASMKVTLNSLSKLAWLLSFLRHACSGGAPPSKSNCREPNRPRPHQPQVPPEQDKREPKIGSPAAARSGRRNPPLATSASGSGNYCRSPSPPNSSCPHEMVINPCSSPQARSRSEARSRRSAGGTLSSPAAAPPQ
jgi:hypothetical protein